MKIDDIRISALPEIEDSYGLSKYCEEIINKKSMEYAGYNFDEGELSDFLGISPLTLAQWIREDKFPKAAKAAIVFFEVFSRWERRFKKSTEVIEHQGQFSICEFELKENGERIGRIIAQNIPDKETAKKMAMASEAISVLDTGVHLMRHELDMNDDGVFDWLFPDFIRGLEVLDFVEENQKAEPNKEKDKPKTVSLDELLNLGAERFKYEIDIGGEVMKFNRLGALLEGVVSKLAQEDPNFLERLGRETRGKRKIVAKDKNDLYPGRADLSFHSLKISGIKDNWYVGTNYSRYDVRVILGIIAKVAGLKVGEDMKFKI